jgi:ATP-dependent DNA helicase DinG
MACSSPRRPCAAAAPTGRRRGAHRRAPPRRAGRPVRGGEPVRLCREQRGAGRHRRQEGRLAALAGAYARLIEAAEGGTLGLFTAIQRLKAVHARIADRLARAGLPLYAQHVDPIDTGTLVDIFRDDPHASLLGTDALRDGVDVPGESLRLVVMEGVPWPRPTVLHAARRASGGGSAFDDRVVRARLAQAFGRLIRRQQDRGMFVLLSAATPSRLLDAFPPGVRVHRLPLDQAIAHVRARLAPADMQNAVAEAEA